MMSHLRATFPLRLRGILLIAVAMFSIADARSVIPVLSASDGRADCCPEEARTQASGDDCCNDGKAACPLPCQFCDCPARAIPLLGPAAIVTAAVVSRYTDHSIAAPLLDPEIDIVPLPPRFA